MKYESYELWDQGMRQKNEDALGLRIWEIRGKSYVLALVCDGIGGLKQGEDAASCTVATIQEELFSYIEEHGGRLPRKKMKRYFVQWIYQCHERIKTYGKIQGIKLGTTLSMVYLENRTGYMFQLGDSAVYKGRQFLKRISAIHRNESGQLIKAVGVGAYCKPQIKRIRMAKKDVLLLCSDGFYNKADAGGKFFPKFDRACPKKWTYEVLKSVRGQGENDNVTALVLWTKKGKAGGFYGNR